MFHLRLITSIVAAVSLVFHPITAHPGEHHDDIADQITARNEFARKSARSLDECMNSPEGLARTKRAIERREEFAHQLRRKRSLSGC